ncbi:MAG: putative DNA-binding domain-containing protein [Candidatus Margulisiibacteriota bacterium]
MKPEPKPPAELKDIQEWMADVVSFDQPLTVAMRTAAKKRITATSKQSAEDRIEIYTNDFWPRCYESLAEDFPSLVALWGESDFDVWMTRYIKAHPSVSYTLYYLGQFLPHFLETHYHEANREIVLDEALYDWACSWAYFADAKPYFDPEQLSEEAKAQVATLPLILQPHVTLLSSRSKSRIVYRNREFKVCCETIPKQFLKILALLDQSLSLEAALTDPSITGKLGRLNLEKWFAYAIGSGWFQMPPIPTKRSPQ